MLITVSPAKKMDMTPVQGITPTTPVFKPRAAKLATVARDLSVGDLMKLMHISENLAKLNADRFRDYGKMDEKPAALAFAGDTYQGLEFASLDGDEMAFAQDHLQILSGLYGVLRPLDAIQPYRLEMGSRLKTPQGKNLYEYWGSAISKELNKRADAAGTDILVNCASQEYFGAVDQAALKPRIITPVFMEEKPQGPKVVSFFAKRARGAMARFIIQNRLSDPAQLCDFDTGGYQFQPDQSDAGQLLFIRPADAAQAA
ncbi:MAG: peroxide stress protein YaaA [Paracoccaceae bacterium]